MKKSALIFIIIVIILSSFLRLITFLQPVNRELEELKSFNIDYGNTSKKIANLLYEKKLIRSQTVFNLLISIFGYDNKIQAGYYEISPQKNMLEIIKILSQGKVATFNVTIPEGITLRELVERVEDKSFYNKEEFLMVAENANFNKNYLPDKKNELKYTLEGFLYPETYNIPKNYNPNQIYKVLLDEFEKNWYNTLKNKSKQSNYSISEYITIASIVEKEAKLDKEKAIIAGVIYNRLDKNMKLQIDATVQYILPSRKERLLYSDLNIDSMYNTYIHSGLPPGPISNPGDKSIEATLNPEETDYLFYFARKDGSHIFSKTYKEHLEKQNEISGN